MDKNFNIYIYIYIKSFFAIFRALAPCSQENCILYHCIHFKKNGGFVWWCKLNPLSLQKKIKTCMVGTEMNEKERFSSSWNSVVNSIAPIQLRTHCVRN